MNDRYTIPPVHIDPHFALRHQLLNARGRGRGRGHTFGRIPPMRNPRDLDSSTSDEGEMTMGPTANGVKNTEGDENQATSDENGVPTPEEDDGVEPGMAGRVKNLYSGKEDKRGRFQWQSTVPKDVKEPVENEATAKFALLVRNVKAYNDPRKTLSVHSIVVQSPLLKKLFVLPPNHAMIKTC